MNKQGSIWPVVLLVLVALWLFQGGIGPAPPFATDQPSALVVEETEQRTTQLTNVFKAIQDQFPGRYRQLDQHNPPTKDEQWVQDAWKVWEQDGKHVPWVVAASKNKGLHQAPPTDPNQAATLFQGWK